MKRKPQPEQKTFSPRIIPQPPKHLFGFDKKKDGWVCERTNCQYVLGSAGYKALPMPPCPPLENSSCPKDGELIGLAE